MTLLQGSSKVHIISHSMGNRITSEALLQYHPAGTSNLGQLIFAAADVDAGVFAHRLAQLSVLGASSLSPSRIGHHAGVQRIALSR
jgi:esterase/lipase superfamily enzyme